MNPYVVHFRAHELNNVARNHVKAGEFKVRQNVLYRKVLSKSGTERWQLVVPDKLRNGMLKLAHKNI